MRILLLAPHPFFESRGTPIAERLLVEALIDRGLQVEILTFHLGQDIDTRGVTVHRIPAIPFIREIRPGFSLKKVLCDFMLTLSCFRILRKQKFDLIHAVEEGSFIALVMKWTFRVPYIYDMDSSLSQQMIEKFRWLRCFRRPMESLEGLAVRGSIGVLAVCTSLEQTARSLGPEKLVGKLEDISMVEPADLVSSPADMDSIGTPRVLYVGNLEKYQGIDLLLESFRIAFEDHPTARLVIVGGSVEHIERYKEIAENLGIGEAVEFLGPRPLEKLGAYLGAADVLVSPRITGTNTPMKIYSYLGSGKPILATDLPTHTQVLDYEVACLAAPVPESMGPALSRLLEDSSVRERLGANAQRRAKNEFTLQAYRRKLAGFYQSVSETIRAQNSNGAGS